MFWSKIKYTSLHRRRIYSITLVPSSLTLLQGLAMHTLWPKVGKFFPLSHSTSWQAKNLLVTSWRSCCPWGETWKLLSRPRGRQCIFDWRTSGIYGQCPQTMGKSPGGMRKLIKGLKMRYTHSRCQWIQTIKKWISVPNACIQYT